MENLKRPKTLKIVTAAVLIHAVLVAFSQILLLISSFYNRNDNPLIPEAVYSFTVFPIYFLLPLFTSIIIYCSKSLIEKRFEFRVIFSLAIFSILYFAFGGELYVFIQSFHSSAT